MSDERETSNGIERYIESGSISSSHIDGVDEDGYLWIDGKKSGHRINVPSREELERQFDYHAALGRKEFPERGVLGLRPDAVLPILVLLLALAAIIVVLFVAPSAHADSGDSTTTAICTANDLGESVPQIVDQLQAGDARWNAFRGTQKVAGTIIGGDCG